MQDFRSVVTALWARLGIGEPRFNEPGRVQLRIDGIGLELTDNGRGLLVVECSAGAFAADPTVRARQVRRVLETNLGFVPVGDAGLYLKSRPNGDKALTGRAIYDYRRTNLDYLVKIIEDVLQVAEYYGAEFKSAASVTTQRSAQPVPDPLGTEVIFRP
jgi:hypothetical protein